MVERIRLLLDVRRLTPTQFADAIGVARPIVSHVLSGRNKPSLEVVQRILAAMPDLSMAWLLNGVGPMLSDGSVPAPSPTPAPVAPKPVVEAMKAEPSFPQALPPARPGHAAPEKNRAKTLDSPLLQRFAPSATNRIVMPVSPGAMEAPAVSAPAPVASVQGPAPAPQATSPTPAGAVASALAATGGKSIRRIVIFYHDGSFADYHPEQ